jgi:beta propeller repeat protein
MKIMLLLLCIAGMACNNCSNRGGSADVGPDEPASDLAEIEAIDASEWESGSELDEVEDLRDLIDPDEVSTDTADMVEEEPPHCIFLDYPALDLGELVPTQFIPSRSATECGENCRQVSITDDDLLMADYDVWGSWLVMSNVRRGSDESAYSRIYLVNLESMVHVYISSEEIDAIYPHGLNGMSGIGDVSVNQNHVSFVRVKSNDDISQERNDVLLFSLDNHNLVMEKTATYHCSFASCWIRHIDLFGNFIAYNDIRETLHEQNFILNLNTREECLISVTGCCTVDPEIYGRNVVFPEGVSSYGVNIYLYNIDTKTTTRLTSGPGDHYSASIWEDIVVWNDTRNGGTAMSQENADVYMMNLTTGVETPVCINPASQPCPAVVWGTKVVWPDCRNDPDYPNVPSRALNWDLYMYDISTGTETQLTSMPGNEFAPKIYENKVYFIMKDTANIKSVFEITLE